MSRLTLVFPDGEAWEASRFIVCGSGYDGVKIEMLETFPSGRHPDDVESAVYSSDPYMASASGCELEIESDPGHNTYIKIYDDLS